MDGIRVKNLYYMLSYAFQTLRETGFHSVASENFENIHDLFAAILIHGVAAQVKRGLYREYRQRQEALAGVCGQIRASETIKQQTHSQGRLVCSYDEFVPDSPHNQALKSVMLLLLRHGTVKADNQKALRRLLVYFSDITEVAPGAIRWDAVKYHRNNASYRMLLGICQLTVKGLLCTTEAGSHKLASWLQDEAMHRLYEKFVLSYYVRHHPSLLPKAALINWDVSEAEYSQYLPVMKSDITLQNGTKRLIIDTKYYGRTMQRNPLYDSRTYISSHLYQIYAYVKNSDIGSTGNVAGVLLYAKTGEAVSPDEDLLIGGSHISLKTLDLNRSWDELTDQLDRLCEWLERA